MLQLLLRRFLPVVASICVANTALAASLSEYLTTRGQRPNEYILAKLGDHRIVIAGENHWQFRDVELIASLVPELRARGIALAMETLQASSQGDIDALLAAPEWDEGRANAILRAANWPYVQYRDILHEVWKTNRAPIDCAPLRIIALGPPGDFREKKIRYDEFMVDQLRDWLRDSEHGVLVYCGMHHAFTRFQQVDRMIDGRAAQFMDRFGNRLWREYGEDVFLVALHKADGCGGWGRPFGTLCAPMGGLIDCAASASGSQPVAFDVAASPIAELKFPVESFYAIGHPFARFIDFADGYIWFGPVDEIGMVDLIPLAELDPAEVVKAESAERWRMRVEDFANPTKRTSWGSLAKWRDGCAK
ncbi:MAG: ChaN family lipoprotein [Acidobacteria bacterium]|nr:ChaN family lipoprotein [Acidobacteriota bacterium]